MGNYVEFFRFCDKYEDVFIEDDHYLYASAEPFNWAYMLACCPYYKVDGGFMPGEFAGADTD